MLTRSFIFSPWERPYTHVHLFAGGRLAFMLDSAKGVIDSRGLDNLREQSAAIMLGAMTMMEGGAVGPFTRQQIEAFCQERLIGKSSPLVDQPAVLTVSAGYVNAHIVLAFQGSKGLVKLCANFPSLAGPTEGEGIHVH